MFKVLIIALAAVAVHCLDLPHAHGVSVAPAVSYSSVASPFGHIHHPGPYPGVPGPYLGLPGPYLGGPGPYLGAYASPVYQRAGIAYPGPAGVVPRVGGHLHDEGPPAQYDFGYSVSDPVTGDVKEQQEIRQGDNVQGRYSLIEADGTRRVVEYSADADGFHAVVHKEPVTGTVPVTAPLAAPVAPLAPLASVVPAVRSFPPVVGVPGGYPYGVVRQAHVAPYSALPQVVPAQAVAYNHLHS